MKTSYFRKQIACGALLFIGYFCALGWAHAQELGQCSEQVLSPPTENSVRVRVTGVNQWPVNSICFWSASGTRSDGLGYSWHATLIGDGLVGTYVNTTVALRYTVHYPGGSEQFQLLLLNFFLPYPSDGFSFPVNSDPAFQSPPEGDLGTWYGTMLGDMPLAFYGRVTLDNANNLQLDITFTGGTLPPDVGELIARVESAGLSRGQQRPLLATLEAAQRALADGDCETGIRILQVFQHKVRAQLAGTDEALADALVAAAQAVIDSSCGN